MFLNCRFDEWRRTSPCHINGWKAICPSRPNVPFATKRADRCLGELFKTKKKRENRILNHFFFVFPFTMNDVDCKTGAACGVGPWFTRLAAHNTPYVVHWVLAGSASFRPQLYTASVRIHTPYTFWMMPEWRKAKVQTKGKTRSNTYTHAQEELCVNPQGTECYIHTHRERKHWEQHGTQTTPLIFCLFEAQKMEGIIGRGVIVESSHWDISSFFVERAKTTTTKKKGQRK